MSTAILSALAEEQGGLVAALDQAECVRHAGRDFWRGRLHGHPVVLALSGIGKVAAATTATVLADRLNVARIVFTGVAGGIGPEVRVGDVVVATHFLQHDMDASPIFARWQVPGYGRDLFACDTALITSLSEAANACLTSVEARFESEKISIDQNHAVQVHQGLVVSGDRFVSTLTESQALAAALAGAGHRALAVEMEGAAVAQVCADYGLPFAAMRTISDRADDSAHVDFPHFIRTVACRYAERIVSRLLRSLPD